MIRWTTPSRWKRVVIDIDTQRCFFPDNGKAQVHKDTVKTHICCLH